ncbi:potassium channel family protein [Caldithrix abyssi]
MNIRRYLPNRRIFTENAGIKAAIIIALSAFVVGDVIYLIESRINTGFKSIGDGIWWFFVTISTVGYGDKVPSTITGKVISILVMFFGVALLSVITATISSIFVAKKLREGKGLQELKLKDHLLLCGWNNNCEQILNLLEKRANEFPAVALINQLPEENIEELLTRYDRLHLRFVRGDYTKESVLLRAAAKNAAAAIIVPDISHPIHGKGDERTILSTLTLKTLNPKIRVIAHIQDAENYAHLNKARADEIVISDAYTGQILANHVLAPGVPRFWEQVFSEDSPVQLNQYPLPGHLIGKTYQELKEYCQQSCPANILIGLVEISEPFDLSNLLSADYSYLDEFIMRKFKEAGLGTEKEKQVKTQLAPDASTVLTKSQFYLVLERKES